MKERRPIEHPIIDKPAVLLVNGLSFHYARRELFADWSTCIPPGVALVCGGDGSGKTTLLRLLAGEQPAHAGHLQVNNICLGEQPAAYRQQVFWGDPQSDAFDQMTMVEYFKSLHRSYPKFDEQVLPDLIEGLSLTPHQDKHLYMLSTGSKRKVWLAAAFASGAALTLLDEPFAALDKASVRFVMKLLEDAAGHTERAWVIAHYEAPAGIRMAAVIDLGD